MEKIYTILKALADKTRLKIAVFLGNRQEVSCKELSKNFKLSQPTLSHHFGKLINSGVILERKEGVNHYYRINHKLLKECGLDLKTIKV
ncbi:MAG: winged helix-turn-helix transcriptional regulator [Candidatus Doudnabacteria bacterium]|nr:winged helix-turn-helix transcriptional regulator [Candidatus Doudnabacteria bacterium]